MRKEITLLVVLALVFASCNAGKQSGNSGNKSEGEIEMSAEFIAEHSSRSAVDWSGVYKGMIPCADCEGIDVEIQLNEDNTYKMVMNYLGRGDSKFTEQGLFEWDETGGKVRFIVEDEGVGNWYRVGENNLLILDAEGNRIENNFPPEIYMLEKIDVDFVLTNKYWKLIELNGSDFSVNAESGNREPFISLKKDESRVSGNTGCNNLMGSFKVDSDYGNEGKLKFSQMATTRMACMDVNYEQDFLKALEDCNNYSIVNDTLSLKKDGKLLAKFTGRYLQ